MTAPMASPGGAVARPAPLPTQAQLLAADRALALYDAEAAKSARLPDLPRPGSIRRADRPKARAAALGQRRLLRSRSEIDRMVEPVFDALCAKPIPDVTRLLLGQLLSCYSLDRLGDFEAFFECLVFDVNDMGFSPTVVAGACVSLRRRMKNRPSIAEIVAACAEKRARAIQSQNTYSDYLKRLDEIHDVLHVTGGDPDQAEAKEASSYTSYWLDEYIKGKDNEFWFDEELNPDLLEAYPDETDEAFFQRLRQQKLDAEAEPEALRVRIAGAYGRRDGLKLADEIRRYRNAVDETFLTRLCGLERYGDWADDFRLDVWREAVWNVVRNELDEPFLPSVTRYDPDESEPPEYWDEVEAADRADADAMFAHFMARVQALDAARAEQRRRLEEAHKTDAPDAV